MKPKSEWHLSRRVFLKTSGVFLAGAVLPSAPFADVPASRPRFGIITDLHYADVEPRGSRYYRDSLEKLRECIGLMNEQKVDFLIELGDLKDQSEPPTEESTLGYLKTIEEVFVGFKGPRYHVLGNHDLDSLSKAQFLAATGMEKPCYSFERGGVRFIVLDANHKADDSDYDHGNFNFVECRIDQRQVAWIQAALDAAKGPVVVFVHQRLDGEGSVFVNNAAQIREILEKSGKVRAVFQGHDHRGDYRQIQGIHYYTLKGAIEGPGPENNAYVVVDMHENGLSINAYRKAVAKSL